MPTTAPTISTTTFEDGQNAWKDAVNASAEALQQAFLLPDPVPQLMGQLSFPIASVEAVLSAVGAWYVRVDFLLSAASTQGNFTAALYAVDEYGKRLTAYYGPATAGPAPALLNNSVIPSSLANLWISQWGTPMPSQPMFMAKNADGEARVLMGFRFSIKSVVGALFVAGESLTMDFLFGLHTFLGADSAASPTRQFGVILKPSNPVENAGTALYHDLAMPCPPY